MQMSDNEILGNYRRAKDQKAQVKILADLNAVSEPEMAEKLRSLGIKVPGRAVKESSSSVDWLRARQLYDEGQSDLEIAEQLGCSKQTLANWRKREGLHANYPKSRPRAAKMAAQPEPPPAVPAGSAGTMTAGRVAEIFAQIAKWHPGAMIRLPAGQELAGISLISRYGAGGEPVLEIRLDV
nr:helix-turn-helix domain-containing protein [uncultured Dysosmobacter sp.]